MGLMSFLTDGIASGDFESSILENIRSRAHFVVLLTPSALNRCNESGDWMRREIEAALDARRNLVPLMLESFDFCQPDVVAQLTGRLSVLKGYNGLSVPLAYFAEAMERLRNRYLATPLDAVLHPASLSLNGLHKSNEQQLKQPLGPRPTISKLCRTWTESEYPKLSKRGGGRNRTATSNGKKLSSQRVSCGKSEFLHYFVWLRQSGSIERTHNCQPAEKKFILGQAHRE